MAFQRSPVTSRSTASADMPARLPMERKSSWLSWKISTLPRSRRMVRMGRMQGSLHPGRRRFIRDKVLSSTSSPQQQLDTDWAIMLQGRCGSGPPSQNLHASTEPRACPTPGCDHVGGFDWRSEEHTSELQSRSDLVCRLLLEK